MTLTSIAVAIPARNEAALIGRCLDALACQEPRSPISVVVLANGCTDGTAEIARVPRGIDVRVLSRELPLDRQGAGPARRLAMEAAAKLGDIVLTTDADCVADPDWVESHRLAFAMGVDAVAGRVSGDWEELRHHPAEALRIGALEWEYLGLMAEAEALFDPRPHDPAPRHAQCCGANIGITREMLARVGGVPPVATGEDRALLAAVARLDGRIRHDPRPHVTASARLAGRASGGMADALGARTSPGYRCDDQFASADALVARWRDRQAARLASSRVGTVKLDGGAACPNGASAMTFGAVSPNDVMPPAVLLVPDDLPAEIARMRHLIAQHG